MTDSETQTFTLEQVLTENDNPTPASGAIVLLVLSGDGARKVLWDGYLSAGDSSDYATRWATFQNLKKNRNDPNATLIYWGVSSPNPPHHPSAVYGEYLPYPLAEDANNPNLERRVASQTDPVNQFAYTPEWFAHISRFSHALDFWVSSDSYNALGAEHREFVRKYFRTMLGIAQGSIENFRDTDPQALKTGTTTLLWKDKLPIRQTLMERLCHECDIATFPRRFADHADIDAFETAFYGGEIKVANRSAEPWLPGDVFASTEFNDDDTEAERRAAMNLFFNIYGNADYKRALKHYDEVIGAADH